MKTVTFFNRHESMNSETRSLILDTIRDLYDYDSIVNSLYGYYDGYNYSNLILGSKEFKKLINDNFNLGYRVYTIFMTISAYKKTEYPNGKVF